MIQLDRKGVGNWALKIQVEKPGRLRYKDGSLQGHGSCGVALIFW